MKLRNGNDTGLAQRSQENASSSLLKLPLEVKAMIYGYVCGQQMVHLFQERSCRDYDVYEIKHRLCCESTSEENEVKFFELGSAGWYNKLNDNPHRDKCRSGPPLVPIGRMPGIIWPGLLDISFFRMCRQIYNEGRLVPYENMTFSFNSWKALNMFMERIPLGNFIRHLRIEIKIVRKYRNRALLNVEHRSGFQAWQRCLEMVVQKMKNVQHLNLDVEYDRCEEEFIFRRVENGDEDQVTRALRVLGRLPLSAATVNLRDLRYEPRDDGEYFGRWTIKEQQQWAKTLRDGLLSRKEPKPDVQD